MKRIIGILCSSAILMQSMCISGEIQTACRTKAFAEDAGIADALYPQGDANRDGTVNAADAVMLQKYLLTEISEISLSADMDSSGTLNAADLTLLKRQRNVKPPVVPYEERSFRFEVADLFDQSSTDTLGLEEPAGLETVTVWKAQSTGDHYCNGVCLASYKGKLYCQWQSSETDEDSADTHVMYAVSSDRGRTWSEAKLLAQSPGGGYCTSGGWLAAETGLVAYINVWPDELSDPRGGWTYYVTSQDGESWTEPKQVTMADGTPLAGIFEQDPHVLSTGRIVCASHLQPGLTVCPIYTDDPGGVTGWKKGAFTATASGAQSVELEPSIFTQSDGTLCMIFRDQSGSYKKLISYSFDDGATWSSVQSTDMPDARTKQSAGNLTDGTAFMAGCPVNNSLRSPLAVTLSADGKSFTQAFLLRSNSSDPALIYEGKAKRLGFHYCKSLVAEGYLYVGYATNKEAVEISIVPEASLMLNG
ncbi:MAG: exo-alpha-sialidase [Oscillospiraceae bacterium]|nr:exo-alpha-sialidase [Oscillospiraceae bacterium]